MKFSLSELCFYGIWVFLKLVIVNGKGRTTLGKGGLERPGEEGPIVEGPSKRGLELERPGGPRVNLIAPILTTPKKPGYYQPNFQSLVFFHAGIHCSNLHN